MGTFADWELGGAAQNLCGFYQVQVVNRATGTTSPACDLSVVQTDLTWQRILSSLSGITFTIPISDGGCCDCSVQPWVDEIRINRHGADLGFEGTVWSGVVTNARFDGPAQAMVITARDRSLWATRDDESNTTIDDDTDQAEIWYRLFTAAVTGNNTGLHPFGYQPTGATYNALTVEGTDVELGTDTSGLLFNGLLDKVKWTVIDRRLFGPGPNTVGTDPWLTLDVATDWASPPVIDIDGAAVTSQVRLSGNDAASETIIASYPPEPVVVPGLGRHITPIIVTGVWTEESLLEEAKRLWQRDRFGHTFITTATETLSVECPATVWDLIPGRVFNVVGDALCLPIDRQQVQLLNVVVDATSDDAPPGFMRETRVAIDLIPVGDVALPNLLSV